MTVDEYLVYCAQLRLMKGSRIRKAVDVAEEKCSITHFKDRLIGNLSGGYKQRVGIAQAIVHNPRLVVLDEPTNGLDPLQIVEIRNLIKEIAQDRAVLLSTHILPEVQAACDWIKMIENGRLVFSGTIDEFNNYVEPSSFLVTFCSPIAVSALQALEGVTEVVALSDRQFRVYFSAMPDITTRVIEKSVAEGWQMKEILLERESVEDIFERLSKGA